MANLHKLLEQLKAKIYTLFFRKGSSFCDRDMLEFLSFCVMRNLHGGRESCHIGLFGRYYAVLIVIALEKAIL